MDLCVDVLLEIRVRPGAWTLLAVDVWVEVWLEARVRPGAWNLLSVDVWVGRISGSHFWDWIQFAR